QLLVLLVLVFARDQLARAWSRLPVDLAQAVADAVLAHPVEVGALAAAALDVRADDARGLLGRQQGEARQRREVREHAHRLRHAGNARLSPQPPRRQQAQLHALEAEVAARRRAQAIAEAGYRVRRQQQRARQAGRLPASRMQVEHIDALAARTGFDLQRDLA